MKFKLVFLMFALVFCTSAVSFASDGVTTKVADEVVQQDTTDLTVVVDAITQTAPELLNTEQSEYSVTVFGEDAELIASVLSDTHKVHNVYISTENCSDENTVIALCKDANQIKPRKKWVRNNS